ncbi:MlaD family protein [Phenylobacterium sp. SCN 70-31]|uniref:MlaD family protein n=1 Tax=Phenylobacterium sp. SCN 70-31 TaxID=1660129 RepID=UPI0008691F5B|nr:MlaD family protein [Phenylobacterium sp. SCN 70-31]ODT89572.1 MAG: ABC transporter substrate-binding protein [Phenylobacterium sp. SCN 70-31]
MEKNANYTLVGLSTLILIFAVAIFIVWLARLSFARDFQLYDIVFKGPVRGLNQGGEVHFNGIKVGEVITIALDKTNPSNVIARVRVTDDVPVRADSFATLEPQGITGLNYVQITSGTSSQPLLEDAARAWCEREGVRPCIPVIRSQRSTLSDLLEGGGTVLTRTIEALDRVNRVLSDQNIKTLSTVISDTQAVTAELRERRAIIADAQSALQRMEEATAEIAALSKTTREVVDGDGRRAIRNLADAAQEGRAVAADARAMLSRLDGPTTDFATHGLPQVTQAVIQLQSTAEALERLVNDIQSSPTGALTKPTANEVKVPQ